jgi:hypothetical protein
LSGTFRQSLFARVSLFFEHLAIVAKGFKALFLAVAAAYLSCNLAPPHVPIEPCCHRIQLNGRHQRGEFTLTERANAATGSGSASGAAVAIAAVAAASGSVVSSGTWRVTWSVPWR